MFPEENTHGNESASVAKELNILSTFAERKLIQIFITSKRKLDISKSYLTELQTFVVSCSISKNSLVTSILKVDDVALQK